MVLMRCFRHQMGVVVIVRVVVVEDVEEEGDEVMCAVMRARERGYAVMVWGVGSGLVGLVGEKGKVGNEGNGNSRY